MTQPSNSNINAVADLKPGYTLGAADVALLQEMARMLLAGMGTAVAGFDAATAIRAYMEEFPEHVHDIVEECAQIAENTISIRHAAPPAPVAVPDERAAFESFMAERFGSTIDRSRVKNVDEEYFAWDMAVAWIVWQRRAAILKAGPVTAAAVPEGWKLVPVEPTWEMLSADGCKEHHDGQKCLHHDNRRRIWRAMLAAAPAAPEQE